MARGTRRLAALLGLAVAGCSMLPGGAPGGGTPSVAAPTPTAASSPRPSPDPTPQATAAPTPTPTPAGSPGLGLMTLTATGCPGGAALDGSVVDDPRFHHYTALRSDSPGIQPAYPPIAPAVDWGESYATDRGVNAAVDPTLLRDVRLYYRAIAFDASDRPIAASPERWATPDDRRQLGALQVEPREAGGTRLDWTMYGGLGRCFSWYNVLYSRSDPFPSVDRAAPVLAVIGDQSASELVTDALAPGITYHLRVQAVRASPLGSLVVAETDVTTYVAPLAP